MVEALLLWVEALEEASQAVAPWAAAGEAVALAVAVQVHGGKQDEFKIQNSKFKIQIYTKALMHKTITL